MAKPEQPINKGDIDFTASVLIEREDMTDEIGKAIQIVMASELNNGRNPSKKRCAAIILHRGACDILNENKK